MATIHVIIPCYNVEAYLEQAVESVLNQPSKDIDIVLVDDGSTDGSGAICDQLSARYERVTVIHKENGGVSAARNVGIAHVLSQTERDSQKESFLAFLDADDAWTENFLDTRVRALLDTGYDLIGFQSCTCNHMLQIREVSKQMQEGIYSGGASSVWLHAGAHFGAMLYSVGFLRRCGIRFREGLRYSEDKIFSLQCMYLAGQIYLENRPMYLYRVSGDSAMGRRGFGIPYYQPIVEAYLELDRNMERWADDRRGVLTVGRICASRYLSYMMEEHFQQWRGKREMDRLLAAHPEYVALLKGQPPYQMMPSNPRYEIYEKSPVRFAVRHYLLGVPLFLRRWLGAVVKRLR